MSIIKTRKFYLPIGLLIFYLIYSNFINHNISKNWVRSSIQNRISNIESTLLGLSVEITPDDLPDRIDYVKLKNTQVYAWSSNQYFDLSKLKFDTKTVQIVSDNTGQFLARVIQSDSITLVYYSKIYHTYYFENEYLKSGFTWKNEIFDGVILKDKKNEYPILLYNNDVFSYLYFEKSTPSHNQLIILTVLYVLLYLSLLALIFNSIKPILNSLIRRIVFYTSLLILYLSFIYLPIFDFFQTSDLFQPISFAYSTFLSSIMRLFLLAALLPHILIFEKSFSRIENNRNELIFKILNLILVVVSIMVLNTILRIIVQNTASNMEFSEISEINIISILVYLTIITFITSIILMLLYFRKSLTSKNIYVEILVSAVSIFLFYLIQPVGYWSLVILIIGAILLIVRNHSDIIKPNTYFILLAITISLYASVNLYSHSNQKEVERRKILIQNLALNQDPEAEFLFAQIESKIYSDSSFYQLLENIWLDSYAVEEYLTKNYFSKSSHWSRYDFQFTSCNQSTKLVIRTSGNEVDCDSFFFNNLISKGVLTSSNNLYRMEYGSGQINYLGVLRFNYPKSEQIITVYVEINSKINRKGFTKLLSPKGMDPFEKIRSYSLAKYTKGYLSESYGDFSFVSQIQDTLAVGQMILLEFNGFSHLLYKPVSQSTFLLSRPLTDWLQPAALFTNIFLFLTIIGLLFVVFFNHTYRIWNPLATFSLRLQVFIISLLSLTLVFIAIISGYFLKASSIEKEEKYLNRTALSLQTEFEQKLAKSINTGDPMEDYLYELSLKFSSVFNTDINLYSLEGELISTTKPQLLEYNLVSRLMNPEALKLLQNEKHTYIELIETVGDLEYYSAYMPFHDKKGDVVAYLNLPHIGQQDQLAKEFSRLIMTLMNAYTLIIVVSLFLIIILAQYFTRPLNLVKEKMQRVKFGGKNEHINYRMQDEIGELIMEYNRMIDQITQSASLLAKAEREDAWKSMAQQVAHEIKNPLTPMKLSVQYLNKAIQDGQPGWQEKMESLSKTLIDQIDTLSNIASAFSDFAKMPVGEFEVVNLCDIIDSTIQLFKDDENIEFSTEYEVKSCYIFGDKNNLIRVFNNLIKNSVQSFGYQTKGKIKIAIEDQNNKWKITIQDNGCGIPDGEKSKIFQPNFTTKSSGMGLGLVMVRNIVLQYGGNIEFESSEGIGTQFIIIFEKRNENKN